MGEALGYASHAQTIEWRYLRLSLLALLVLCGWVGFSAYVSHLYGDVWIGGMPLLRKVRALMLPKISIAIYTLTAINLAYLLHQFFTSKYRTSVWFVYFALAIVPAFGMWVNEIKFGHFIVE